MLSLASDRTRQPRLILEKALGSDADVLVVSFPEVLGDTYTELVINLGRIAASGKSLGITKASPWLLTDKEIDLYPSATFKLVPRPRLWPASDSQ